MSETMVRRVRSVINGENENGHENAMETSDQEMFLYYRNSLIAGKMLIGRFNKNLKI